jgi:hypothetical protein
LEVRKGDHVIFGFDFKSADRKVALFEALLFQSPEKLPTHSIGMVDNPSDPTHPPFNIRFRHPAASGTLQKTNIDDLSGGGKAVFYHANQVEAQLYTRDPGERFATLVEGIQANGYGKNPDFMVSEISSAREYPFGEQTWALFPVQLPNVLPISNAGPYPLYSELLTLDPSHFWLREPLPTQKNFPFWFWGGAGTNPEGSGSVKAVYAFAHSPCEAEVDIQTDIVNEIKKALRTALLGAQCGTQFVSDVSIDGISITSYVRLDENVSVTLGASGKFIPGVPVGGILLGGHVTISLAKVSPYQFKQGRCAFDFLYEYKFKLDAGFLAVEPIEHRFVTNNEESIATLSPGLQLVLGPLAPSFVEVDSCLPLKDIFQQALRETIPQIVRQKSEDKTTIVLSDADARFKPFDLATFANNNVTCLGVATTLAGFAIGGASIFFNRTILPTEPLGLALTAVSKVGASQPWGQQWGNWVVKFRPETQLSTCTPGPPVGRCAFIMRAMDIIVNPDTVDLVWFHQDALRSTADAASHMNTGLFLFFVLMNFQNPPIPSPFDVCGRPGSAPCQGYRVLCTRPYQTVDTTEHQYVRYYATAHQTPIDCASKPFGFDWCCEADDFPWKCDPVAHRLMDGPCKADNACWASEHCVAGKCVPMGRPCDSNDPFGPGCPSGSICQDAGYGSECRR